MTPLLSVGDIPVTIKQLNLDVISDEVLDECFVNENDFVSLNQEVEEDVEVQGHNDEPQMDHFSSIKDTSDFIPNEELLRNVANGVNVSWCREKLVRQNYGLVYSEARKCTCNIPFSDKLQYGFEGLLNAMNKYDVNQATLFSTYAIASIRKFMYRNGNNDVRIVALPEYLSVHSAKIMNFVDAFVEHRQVQPTAEEIADGTGIDVRRVKRVLANTSGLVSMDAPVHGVESDVTLQDVITGDSDGYLLDETCMSEDFRVGILQAMSHLNDFERTLFAMVNGFDGYRPMPFNDIVAQNLIDERGKRIASKATLSRRYNDVLARMAKIIERLGIQLRDK